MTHIIVSIDHDPWRDELVRPEDRIRAAVAAALRDVAVMAPLAERAEVGVVLADDARVQRLNRDYRGRDEPTNVLSFQTMDVAELQAAAAESTGAEAPPLVIGDIILAFETAAREARAFSRSLDHHLMHLVVHGTLHLLGFDHETAAEAQEMERHEREILAAFGIDDPYVLPADDLRDSIESNL